MIELFENIDDRAERGPVGEYIESRKFDIELAEKGNNRGTGGCFKSGLLTGKSVNVKVDTTPNYVTRYLQTPTGNDQARAADFRYD